MKLYNLLFFLLFASGLHGQTAVKRGIIFDTDMGPDYDDVGAIAMLHAFADKNECRILGTIASTKYEGVAAVLSVLNTYFKRPEIPIGVPNTGLTLRDTQHWSDSIIAKYPHQVKSNSDADDAIRLYRKILSKEADNSVTIITVGFFTNIAALLRSPADQYSSLNGQELVRQKVERLVSMAGRFPSGKEFNVAEDALASQYVFTFFPKPILLSGFEIGMKIKSGLPLIHNASIKDSPVKDVFRISIPMSDEDKDGRMSWDQTAVLAGVRNAEPLYKLMCGTMKINSDGSNEWLDSGKQHCRLIEEASVEKVQKIINELMQHTPR